MIRGILLRDNTCTNNVHSAETRVRFEPGSNQWFERLRTIQTPQTSPSAQMVIGDMGWLLCGHEQMAVLNTEAALEAALRTVCVTRRLAKLPASTHPEVRIAELEQLRQ